MYSNWLFFLLILLWITDQTFCKSILADLTTDNKLPLQLENYLFDQNLEDYKNQIRQKVLERHPNGLNSLALVNISVTEQRLKLKQYRAKLLELRDLDTSQENTEEIHVKEFHSYAMHEDENRNNRYTFDVNIPQPKSARYETKVHSAHLRLRRKTVSSQQLDQLRDSLESDRNVGVNVVLLVYQSLPAGMRRLVTSSVISLASNSTLDVDLKEMVQNWIDEPGMNYGIEIECQTYNISDIIEQPSESDNVHLSTLDIYTYESKINVARRQARSVDHEECPPRGCCRYPVTIKYKEVGMHIEGLHGPDDSFNAYMCDGRCSRNHKLHNYWSHIKNSLRGTSGGQRLKNRCAPTSFERFQYTHYNADNVLTFTEYDDILVKECGCV